MRVVTIPVGALQSNCYLVADSETREAVVIDPGDESTIILEQIDQNNLIIQAILLTHAHFDHIMAVVPEFDLQIFQEPSGSDFQKIAFPKTGDLKH